jgi:lipopolysaccharide export system protein LptC
MAARISSASGFYSRMVATAKIVMPLIALALMSTVFLVQTTDNFSSEISFSEADFSFEDGLRLSEPRLSGSSRRGDVFRIEAVSAIPENASATEVTLNEASGRFELINGQIIDLTTQEALVFTSAQRIEIRVPVSFKTSDGYFGTAQNLYGDIASGRFESRGAVKAEGPLGQISADRFNLVPVDSSKEQHVVTFEGNVRVFLNAGTAK